MKILVNGITLENAHLNPLLTKIKIWQKYHPEIWFIGNADFKRKIKKLKIIGKNFNFIEIGKTKRIKTRADLIFEGLLRNIKVWQVMKNSPKQAPFDLIYTISSVLDLILFPYFLKVSRRKIKWATVFDNTVPLIIAGNIFVRFLAWLFFQISLWLLKKADYIFVISPTLKSYLLKRGFSKKKIILTGNAVEAELIKKAQPQRQFKTDALYLGRINEIKGIYDLLNVLEIVKKHFPSFKLGILGEGDSKEVQNYKNKIMGQGFVKNIKFLGFKTGLTKFNLIKSSKIFLFLSHAESFGVALLEAVCCGLPALAYDLPCYRRLYKDGEVFLFKKNDYQGVADKIMEILDTKSFVNEKGRKLQNKYSWSEIAAKEFKAFLHS